MSILYKPHEIRAFKNESTYGQDWGKKETYILKYIGLWLNWLNIMMFNKVLHVTFEVGNIEMCNKMIHCVNMIKQKTKIFSNRTPPNLLTNNKD